MKKILCSSLFVLIPTFTVAGNNASDFFFDTYNYAKSSKILNTAAKCELSALRLNYPYSSEYSLKAIAQLSMNLEYSSHSLLEYQLAYDVVKNYHYGRFSVIDTYDKDNVKSNYTKLYKQLKCNELVK